MGEVKTLGAVYAGEFDPEDEGFEFDVGHIVAIHDEEDAGKISFMMHMNQEQMDFLLQSMDNSINEYGCSEDEEKLFLAFTQAASAGQPKQ